MTEIRVGTVSDAAGTGPAVLTGQYAAKTSSVYDHTVPTTIRSENISSITDNATGYFTLTFTNGYDAADYGHSGYAESTAAGHPSMFIGKANAETYSTAATRMGVSYGPTAAEFDSENVAVQTFGDLA